MSTEIALTGHANASLPDRLEYARSLAMAGLLPDAFRQQPANVLLGMELASALDLAPIVVINELAVIGGKPSFSAKFMRALVRRAGHRLRESFIDGVARCVIVRADDPDWEHAATWDETKARQHDYWGKGHWKKNPELMLKNRALSECVREACPEVLGGVAYTPDEVADFVPAARVEQVDGPNVEALLHGIGIDPPKPTPATPASPQSPGDLITASLDGEVMVTSDQTHELAALMSALDLTKPAMLKLAREITGRTIKGSTDMTEIEADLVIADLRSKAEAAARAPLGAPDEIQETA